MSTTGYRIVEDAEDWAAEVDAQMSAAAGAASGAASGPSSIVNKVQSLSISQPVTASGDTASVSSGDTAASAASSGKPEENALTDQDASLLRKLVRNKLVTTTANLEVIRKDPNSPLYSVKTFESLNLKPELLKGVYDMGFNAPSKIQETALPALLADPPINMIAQSQSGTGKTAAFVLTMLSRVDSKRQYTQCLCVAPTYELALQIGQVTTQMAKHLPSIQIGYAVRGESVTRGQAVPYQIVIGTPGTVLEWIQRQRAIDPRKIDVFVLDEADVMISTQGHQDQSIRIHRDLRKNCQILFFSATFEKNVMDFAHKIVPDPMTIRLRREEESLDNIKQYYIVCSGPEEKFEALGNIYGTISIGQSMIFCATRRTASWLSEKMAKEGHAVALLSGELNIEQRAAIIQRFRDGKEKVLITTNVSARGIDVEQVTVVVNFDMPVTVEKQPDCETYLHRIGRTGRFGKNGIAINMVDGSRSMKVMEDIEKHFGRPIVHLRADETEDIEKIAT